MLSLYILCLVNRVEVSFEENAFVSHSREGSQPNAETCALATNSEVPVLFTDMTEDTSWILLKFFIPPLILFFTVFFESVNFAFVLKFRIAKRSCCLT